MARSFEHFLQYVTEQVEVPPQPRSLGACHRAIAKMYAAVLSLPEEISTLPILRREAHGRLGDENIARIEAIAAAWRNDEEWPLYR